MIYAGIGSRETPLDVLQSMHLIGEQLGQSGWLLRSGGAPGADRAFETGCCVVNGKKEIFIPWHGFNGAPRNHPDYIRRLATQELADFSAKFHPAWSQCSDATKLLHMRNACQVLGADGDSPVNLVICWTKQGKGQGGTGQAIRIAQHFDIPVFDLAIPGVDKKLCAYIAMLHNS